MCKLPCLGHIRGVETHNLQAKDLSANSQPHVQQGHVRLAPCSMQAKRGDATVNSSRHLPGGRNEVPGVSSAGEAPEGDRDQGVQEALRPGESDSESWM